MRTFIIAALTTAAFAAPAAAQSGFRAEARIGYDRPVATTEASVGADRFEESEGVDGFGYGAEVGYDYRGTQALVGGYVNIDGSTAKTCSELYGLDELCIRAGRNVSAGARIGYLSGGGQSIYVKGGYSNGRVRATYEDFEDILDDVSGGENRDGFHVGAGGEFPLGGARPIYGKLEYTYTSYSGADGVFDGARIDVGLERHQVFAGVGIRF